MLPSRGLKYNCAKHAHLLQLHILFLIPFHRLSDEGHVNNLGEDVEVLFRGVFVQLEKMKLGFQFALSEELLVFLVDA